MRGTDPDARAVPAMRVQLGCLRSTGVRSGFEQAGVRSGAPRGRLPRLHLFASSVRDAQRPESAFKSARAEPTWNSAQLIDDVLHLP